MVANCQQWQWGLTVNPCPENHGKLPSARTRVSKAARHRRASLCRRGPTDDSANRRGLRQGGAPFVVHEGLASSSARRLVVRSKRDNLPVNDGPPCRCCTPGHCLRDVTASAKTASRWRPGNFTNPPRVNRSIKADGTLAGV